jgi:coproporphyrinogen III oxidase-like Fe-S oxidoreductase
MLHKQKLPVESKQRLSPEDIVKRKLMFQVRGSIPTKFNFPEPDKIKYLINEKLLDIKNNEYKLSTSGQLFITEIQEYLAS